MNSYGCQADVVLACMCNFVFEYVRSKRTTSLQSYETVERRRWVRLQHKLRKREPTQLQNSRTSTLLRLLISLRTSGNIIHREGFRRQVRHFVWKPKEMVLSSNVLCNCDAFHSFPPSSLDRRRVQGWESEC